ncbi:MAG: GNAT family N-acetyltransferase [Promethearchaeota archaeon]
MEIKRLSVSELDFLPSICLDPSVGRQLKEIMKKCMEQRICWIKKMMEYGLEILVALDIPKSKMIHYKWAGKMKHSDLAIRNYVPMGLLESIPIEFALEPIEGESSLFINCIWILPPFWNRGVGKTLMRCFIKQANKVGGASVIAYDGDNWFGTKIKYMPLSFFRKFGFKEIEREGTRVLLHLDLGSKKLPYFIINKTESVKPHACEVNIFVNNQCPWSCFMIDDIKKNIKKYPDIRLKIVNTNSREDIRLYGISRGITIDGKPLIKRMVSWSEIKSQFEKNIKSIGD